MFSSGSSSSSSSKDKKKVGGKKLNILIVDNDGMSQSAYILCLQRCGVETLGVRNGKVAVRIHDITQMRFDLILMSYVMPDMDGIQETKKLRSMGITTMIVGMTTLDDNENIAKNLWKLALMNAMKSH
ncbi:hypothetical protein HAX54_050005 [Datura stramonium]|uniref:Response regulatory domain-containing protein n=1 Tax=Datura stramonium TaxID=4076 RepID=A0ABS8WN21_DATST|nr:hypothetical protein [Datura stramonium]